MHHRTETTLEKLREVQWFRCIGVHDAHNAEVLSSWYEAIESCTSPEWEELCMDAVNHYRERLAKKSPERFQKWNETVDEIKPVVQMLVRQKVTRIIEDHDLPKAFIDTVDWDILHLCMESEFSDAYPPGFFASQAYWYVKGHFPCGWRGHFPEGRLIIF